MESADGQRGRDAAGQRRSPLDLIMSQIRRKRSAADRKSSSGRFLSRTSDRGGGDGGVVPEDRDTEDRDHRDVPDGSGVLEPAENDSDLGWGRMCVFLQKLGKKADSRSLNVAHCDLTATDILELATLLQYLPQLEDMDISWNELIGGSLRALTSHLQHVGGLRTLALCSCRLNTDDVVALGEALGCVPLLETLDLSWNIGVGGGALQGLLGKLGPTLRQLHLVACQLTAADATALGGIVSALPRLSVLDVSCNPLLSEEDEAGSSKGGLGELSASLCHATSLTTLRLQACGLTANSLHALGGSLRYLPALRELDLSCNRGLAGGMSHLTFHLVHLTHLESLDLHLCCLTHADLESLIQALPSLAELTELDVSSNKEVGGVVHSLGSALPLVQMRRLPLNSCSLNQESFTAFALAVPYLSSVDVSWCKVVGGRLALLLDALQPSVVQELRLSSCQLTTDDLHHLAEACKRGSLSSLRLLDLSYNHQVGDQAWTALFTAAGAGGGGLSSLQDVDLSLRPSTSAAPPSPGAWLPALLSALPRLPALTRLAMGGRWGGGSSNARGREQLAHSLQKRRVLFQWDHQPANKERGDDVAAVSRGLTNQDGAEVESRPEE